MALQQLAAASTNGTGATNLTATTGAAILAGDTLLLVVYCYQGGGAATLSATTATVGGVSLVVDASYSPTGTAIGGAVMSKHNAGAQASGASVSVTNNVSVSYWGWVLYREPNSLTTGALDVTAATDSGGSTAPSSGSTASVAGGTELQFGAVFVYDTTTNSASNWAITTSGVTALTAQFVGGTGYTIGCLPGYQEITSASGTYSIAGTDTGATVHDSGAICCVYKNVNPTTALPRGSFIVGQAVRRAAYYHHPEEHPHGHERRHLERRWQLDRATGLTLPQPYARGGSGLYRYSGADRLRAA